MFLDLAFGIIVAILADSYFSGSFLSLLLASLLFSIMPDLDFVIYKVLGIHKDKGYKHRDLFHYPLIYLPIGFILIYFFSGVSAVIFLIISFLHFAHDSIAYGRGVKWLFPFSKNSYAFIYLYSRVKKIGLWQAVFVFNEGNINKWDEEHGDENWIKNIYLAMHPIAIVEFGGFVIALIWLFFYLK